MTKALKVWGGCFDGLTRQIVAAPTKKAAAEALKQSLYHFNIYGCETGNGVEMRTALAEPGVPFSAPVSGPRDDSFVRGLVRCSRGQPWPTTLTNPDNG